MFGIVYMKLNIMRAKGLVSCYIANSDCDH